MTLKTVLNEGKSSILHRVVKSACFDPHRARNCARFIRFLQTLRDGALRRALLFLAAPRRVRPLLTTEEAIIGCDGAERGRSQMWFSWKEIGKSAA